jgi:ferric-dicitrate binding protein FerR (iron transport regulator)
MIVFAPHGDRYTVPDHLILKAVAMKMRARTGWIACAFLAFLAGPALAQPANLGCTSKSTAQGAQTLQCEQSITIVTEDGAKFELRDRNRDGRVDSVELSNKALLIEVPKKPGGNRFNVVTPQAIAAVRGTKWAVDASEGKTSVFVVEGSVNVTRPSGGGDVVLKPGDGVDVEPTGTLIVKRWPPARVAALMARLGR